MSDSVGMSFKAKMNNLAKKLGLRPQTVIQNYMFERFLARLAQSQYRENFVVKGGVLIAAMIGLKARSTMDMDTTVIGLPMTQRSIRHAIGRIAAEDLGDDVAISVVNMGRIRIQNEYWRRYQQEFPYAKDISFEDAVAAVRKLLFLQ